MKVVMVACTKCGARSTSPFGLCAECELDPARTGAESRTRRIREQVRVKRAA